MQPATVFAQCNFSSRALGEKGQSSQVEEAMFKQWQHEHPWLNACNRVSAGLAGPGDLYKVTAGGSRARCMAAPMGTGQGTPCEGASAACDRG